MSTRIESDPQGHLINKNSTLINCFSLDYTLASKFGDRVHISLQVWSLGLKYTLATNLGAKVYFILQYTLATTYTLIYPGRNVIYFHSGKIVQDSSMWWKIREKWKKMTWPATAFQLNICLPFYLGYQTNEHVFLFDSQSTLISRRINLIDFKMKNVITKD